MQTTPQTIEKAADSQNVSKSIKINLIPSNLSALWDAINAAEGNATARTARVKDANDLAAWADAEMAGIGLPKKYQKGAKATFLPGAVCGSYGHAAYGTWLEITRGPNGWFLTGVDRREVGSGHGGGYDRQKLQLTLDQQLKAVKSNPHFAKLASHLAALKAI